MEKITERENFLRMLRHERPDFMPHQPSLLQMIIPSAIGDRAENCGTGYDWFGVHWTEDPDMPMMPMVTPGMPPVLEDIEDWEEVIEWPDLDAIDWEACARKDVPVKDPSKILCAMMVSGPFERLHDLMGFEGALCALVTNPEECEAFFSRLCDFKIEQIKRLKEHYDVDMVHFQDDWGTQTDLMFQPEIWRTLIRPHVKRVVDAAHDLGVLFDQHSCGKIDRIVGEGHRHGHRRARPRAAGERPAALDRRVQGQGGVHGRPRRAERHRPSRRHRRRDHGGGQRQDRPVRQRGRALHPLRRVAHSPT